MAVITTEKNMEEFLKECTYWGDDGCYKFSLDNAQGLYRDVPEYCGKIWALRMVTEPQDWISSTLPDRFPVKADGSFCYLIDKNVFDIDQFPQCLTQDFLSPWDFNPHYTRWYQSQTDRGTMNKGLSIHGKHGNLKRYITYMTDKQNRPVSNVLYQYLVDPTEVKKRNGTSTSKPVANIQKRKSEPIRLAGSSSGPKESTVNTAKRRKSEFPYAKQPQKASSSKNTPIQRKTKEVKPLNPSPPLPESSTSTPVPSTSQQQSSNTVFEKLRKEFDNLQQVISDTKKRYCALTNPMEMIAMNEKLIRFVSLESEIKTKIETLAEKTKLMTEEIMVSPVGRLIIKSEPV